MAAVRCALVRARMAQLGSKRVNARVPLSTDHPRGLLDYRAFKKAAKVSERRLDCSQQSRHWRNWILGVGFSVNRLFRRNWVRKALTSDHDVLGHGSVSE
jgi:hypothetical protein